MSSKPLVSAIIIFFNAEKFFEEAVESVFAQTYDNWELLLVDDGSTDSSTAIAHHYAEKYPKKVRYLVHEGHRNRGMSATRNLGIRHARGEYIAFLDADDVWLPYKLERQVPILMEYSDAAMLYGTTSYDWYSWTGDPDDMQNDFEHKITNNPNVQVNKPLKTEEFLHLFLQRKVLLPSTTSLLVRREVAERIGGFEESFRGLFEDQVFIAKVKS
jgi:glycosyltransferase involved in cell wall biosynthesis